MKSAQIRPKPGCYIDIDRVAGLIADTQRPSGEIPWHDGEKTDPWDHIEAAIGLTVGGFREEARRAFRWLADRQLPDGSWYSAYDSGEVRDRTRESHMAAYISVGVYHDYLVHKDIRFLDEMWPVVDQALAFAVSLQAPGGEIYWAVSPRNDTDPMALLTASSSVFMSLKCGLAIAHLLGRKRPEWLAALRRLGLAIRTKPFLFNMTKSRYAMDWFYPVLSGAMTGGDARQRIGAAWRKFVVMDQGVRCVSDQPWVTIAETSELCLALAAMGNPTPGRIVFSWVHDKTYEDGAYWCGFTYPDMVIWPEDKITWTNAAVLMAADALYGFTEGAALFSHRFWAETEKGWGS